MENNFKERRQAMIDRLVEQQDRITAQPTPRIVSWFATVVATVITVIHQQLAMLLSLVATIGEWIWIGAKLPFSYLYYAFDVTMITCWHGRQVYKRMIGEPTPRRIP